MDVIMCTVHPGLMGYTETAMLIQSFSIAGFYLIQATIEYHGKE